MRGLARLDRPLDRHPHFRRKNPPHPPAVLEKVFADTLDAHAASSRFYQLPDAPPPPKLPPPPENPPLSLELPLPLHEPPEAPPPDQPPLRLLPCDGRR